MGQACCRSKPQKSASFEEAIEDMCPLEIVGDICKSHSMSPSKPFGISSYPQSRLETQDEESLDVRSSYNGQQPRQAESPGKPFQAPTFFFDHSTTYNALQFEQLQAFLKSRPKQFDHLILEQQRDFMGATMKQRNSMPVTHKLIVSDRHSRNLAYQERRQSQRQTSSLQNSPSKSPRRKHKQGSDHSPSKSPTKENPRKCSTNVAVRPQQLQFDMFHSDKPRKQPEGFDALSPSRRSPSRQSQYNPSGILKKSTIKNNNSSIISEQDSGQGSSLKKRVRFKDGRKK